MRKINRAVKIRIYPNAEQRVQIEKTIGCSRFIYNCMLADKMEHYKKEKKMLRNTPASYKKEYPWLKEVDSLALANVQMHLESAFHKFFREPSAGFPRFKSKKSSRKSYTTNVVNGNIFLEGKYFASLLFCCENQTAEKRPAEKFIGIDFAMQGMCVFSTGSIEIQRKSLRGNRESCPDVRKAVRIIRSRRKELHCAMKRSEIKEKTFSINSVPVLLRASMQYAWKI